MVCNFKASFTLQTLFQGDYLPDRRASYCDIYISLKFSHFLLYIQEHCWAVDESVINPDHNGCHLFPSGPSITTICQPHFKKNGKLIVCSVGGVFSFKGE